MSQTVKILVFSMFVLLGGFKSDARDYYRNKQIVKDGSEACGSFVCFVIRNGRLLISAGPAKGKDVGPKGDVYSILGFQGRLFVVLNNGELFIESGENWVNVGGGVNSLQADDQFVFAILANGDLAVYSDGSLRRTQFHNVQKLVLVDGGTHVLLRDGSSKPFSF